MNAILIATAAMGSLGLIFGALLALVSRLFAVPVDERKSALRDCLPGANCGGCGFAGCDAYAEAVASGKAEVGKCPVGGEAVAKKMGDIMGVTVSAQEPMMAFVRCQGDLEHCQLRFDYEGPRTCKNAALAASGDKGCRFSCLGYGDCVEKCAFGALTVDKNRLAHVDPDKCRGCGQCVTACPRGILTMLPRTSQVYIACSALDKGKAVRDHCTAGCISCGKCARTCDFGAITMVNNLPQIEWEKCVGCMRCADGCPTGALQPNEEMRRRAIIRYDKCTGCGECVTACKYKAILGEAGNPHNVNSWYCVGCGECAKACPEQCIQLVHAVKLNKAG